MSRHCVISNKLASSWGSSGGGGHRLLKVGVSLSRGGGVQHMVRGIGEQITGSQSLGVTQQGCSWSASCCLRDMFNHTNVTVSHNEEEEEDVHKINVLYTVCECLVAFGAVVGNGLVLLAFKNERRLRRRTNYYIVSLAAADLLVGLLGIPFAILASVGLPTQLHACLFTVSLLVMLCTISIFSLVAVSADRYWAIIYPMGYSRNVRTRTAIGEKTGSP
ncbi:hypothetical protein B566_EDAN016994 [Ephemera danica]|nr:hypothetical protein B566_EDAN016994 [Ephemera danica]